MDSPEIREGVTLYFPVFQPGALFYLGDGHAEQGDGELPGQGLETSMDVQFSVDVIPGQVAGPAAGRRRRLCDGDGHRRQRGCGHEKRHHRHEPLAGRTYDLTPQDIAAVLGTAMKYEIAEVVDSEYDVVAKVPKDALAKIHQ